MSLSYQRDGCGDRRRCSPPPDKGEVCNGLRYDRTGTTCCRHAAARMAGRRDGWARPRDVGIQTGPCRVRVTSNTADRPVATRAGLGANQRPATAVSATGNGRVAASGHGYRSPVNDEGALLMDDHAFDRLARCLTSGSTRRGIVAGLTSALLAFVPLALSGDDAAARRRHKRKKRKKKQSEAAPVPPPLPQSPPS